MRLLAFLSLGIICIGCDASELEAPTTPNISVRIDITGIASLAPATFALSLDGVYWKTVSAGTDQLYPLRSGTYTLGLVPIEGTDTQAWCSALQPTTIGVRVKTDQITRTNFTVNCPPITGTGIVRLSVIAPSVGRLAPLTLIVTKILGETDTRTLTMSVSETREMSLPAGLYRVQLGPNSCSLSGRISNQPPSFAVHDGATSTFALNVYCGPPFVFKLPPGIP